MPEAAGDVRAGDQPAAEPPEWSGFSDSWRKGYRDIFAIRLVRGRAAPEETGRPATYVRWLCLSYGPAILGMAITSPAVERQRLSGTVALLFLLATVNAGMFGAAVAAWAYALRRAGTIDVLLKESSQRDGIAVAFERAVAPGRQLGLPITFAALPWIIAATGEGSAQSPTVTVPLLLNVTWSLAILGNVTYWLLIPPWVMARTRNVDDLALRWNDPARTAGIRTISEGYAYSAIFLAVGALIVTVPGLLGHDLLGDYLPYLYGLLLFLSIWVGVVTQLIIYIIVRRFKLKMMDELTSGEQFFLSEDHVHEIIPRIKGYGSMTTTLSVYGAVAAAPELPYGSGLIVQYVAAVAGSLVGILLQ